MDGLDARIVLELDKDPEATVLTLARVLGIARNTVHARLRRLAADGVLLPFSRRVDLAALGHELVAFMSLSISQTSADAVLTALLLMPEVVARDTHDLHRLTAAILAVDGVQRSSTAVSLSEVVPYRPEALLQATAQTWEGPRGRQ